jgi:hypothetical protein
MVTRHLTTDETTRMRPRVSWGAIFAGAFVSLVSLLVLSSLGTAIGITVNRGDLPDETSSFIWSIVFAMVALFLGGWTVSQSVARETKREALLQGIVLWGVIYFGLFLLSYLDVFTSFNIVMGIDGPSDGLEVSPLALAEIARTLELTPEQMALLEEALGGYQNERGLMAHAWWTLAGVASSLLAAIIGSLAGATRRHAASGDFFPRRKHRRATA